MLWCCIDMWLGDEKQREHILIFNGFARRLLKVTTAFGCGLYLVSASSGYAPEASRRRIPGKPEIPPLRCIPSWGWHHRSGC